MIPLAPGEYAGMQASLTPRLTEACTVLRPTGLGAAATETTVALAVPCRMRDVRQGELAALPGGFAAVRPRAFDLARDADVQPEDVLVTAAGVRYFVRATTADVTDAVLLTAYAEARS